MKATFSRCGEPIPMRVDKRDYLFQENPNGDFVAIIDSEEHVSYLLQTGNFVKYDAEAAKKKALDQMKAKAAADKKAADKKAEAEKKAADKK
jgi:hypothetical protein